MTLEIEQAIELRRKKKAEYQRKYYQAHKAEMEAQNGNKEKAAAS